MLSCADRMLTVQMGLPTVMLVTPCLAIMDSATVNHRHQHVIIVTILFLIGSFWGQGGGVYVVWGEFFFVSANFMQKTLLSLTWAEKMFS